jgi:uncharacterized membrane protein YccF (DUF307 family)
MSSGTVEEVLLILYSVLIGPAVCVDHILGQLARSRNIIGRKIYLGGISSEL